MRNRLEQNSFVQAFMSPPSIRDADNPVIELLGA
jgi:hypothetical protein